MIIANLGQRLAALSAIAMSIACGEPLAPAIESFAPTYGTVGARVTIRGAYFDHDAAGFPIAPGSNAWTLLLVSADERHVLDIESITDHSIVATIPEGATTGYLALADAGGIITQSLQTFEVKSFPVMRFINDAQYDVVDLRLNGEQVLVDNDLLESGAIMRVAVTPDRYRIDYGLGEPRQPWMRQALRSIEIPELGTETEVHIPPIEPLDLLTKARAVTDWVAELRDTRGNPTTQTLRIFGDGAWALFAGITPIDQGQLVAPALGVYAPNFTFSLGVNGPAARMSPPFTAFDMDNGPPHFRLLRYVRVE